MNNYNLGHLFLKQVINQQTNANAGRSNMSAQQNSNVNSGLNSLLNSYSSSSSGAAPQSGTVPTSNLITYQMNNFQSIDRSLFIKDMMNMPKQLNELVYIIQKNITQEQFNQQFGKQMHAHRNMLSQTQAQILAQLQGLSSTEAQAMLQVGNKALLSQLQTTIKNLPLTSSGMINLADLSLMIQNNGKDAITKIITAMANAARSGITDLSQLKDSARIINASIAAASQNDSAQTMKMLLLLYLPWLPLQEGTGFDLEISSNDSDNENDSILIITITTINYGVIKATLILESSNSVHVNIECNKKFPKDELNLRISNDEQHYSMQSVVSYETVDSQPNNTEKREAKVNMSDTNQINPYLLMMAHTIIRHTMEIDRNASIGVISHTDTEE